MAVIAIPDNGNPVAVIAAGAKAALMVTNGEIEIANAADPSGGLVLHKGTTIAIEGWTAEFNAKTNVVGRPATVRVISE